MREVSTLPRKPFSCAFVVIQILTSITPHTYESTTEFVCSSSGRMNMCRCPHRIRNSAIRRRQMINAFRHTSFKCVHLFCSFRFSFFYHLYWWTGLTSKRIQLFSQSTFSFLQMPNNWSWWESEHEMTHLFRGIIHRYHYECCVLCLFWRSIVVYWHSFSSVIIAYDE